MFERSRGQVVFNAPLAVSTPGLNATTAIFR
jgi:hypothetical protein